MIVEGKSLMKKPLNLEEVLGGKPTPYNWGLKKMKESKGRSFDLCLAWSHVQSRIVTCSYVQYGWGCRAWKLSKFVQKHDKNQTQLSFFKLVCWVILAGHPRFYWEGSMGLTVGPAIGGTMMIIREVAIGLSGWSL